MFLQEVRSSFYEIVSHQHVLLVVNSDVDAVSACKILQHLFRCDHVTYTVVSVAGVQDLDSAVADNCDQVKCVVLLNCGGNVTLIERLSPPDDVVFFVIDSHRPFDLDNVYDQRQVRLVIRPGEDVELNCPAFSDIFRNDGDDEDSDSDEGIEGSPTPKRRSLEDRADRIADKRRWVNRRGDLLWNYYGLSYYANSSAVLLFELAHVLSKATAQLLWWAIVGQTSQLLEGKLSADEYASAALDQLRPHVRRFAHTHHAAPADTPSLDNVRIAFEKELMLSFYKHWSLLESVKHSLSTVGLFQLWSHGGIKKLNGFFADLGFPLRECRQKYDGMTAELRKELVPAIEAVSAKYNLPEMVYGSFVAHYAFTHRFSAVDAAASLCALLEFGTHGNDALDENFFIALDTLNLSNYRNVYKGMETYKRFLEAVVTEVHAAITQHQITPCPNFLQFSFPPGHADLRYFTKPHGVTVFGRFLLRAFCATPRGRKRGEMLPLVLEVPLEGCDESTGDWYLLVGVPPLAAEKEHGRPKSFLGRAFDRAAKTAKCRMLQDTFDTAIVRLKSEDRGRFFDALISLLAS